MSDQALAISDHKPLTRQAIAVKERSAPRRVTGKLRNALDAMVWQGACRAEAATVAGMTDHSLRAALKKPHVKAYYLHELEVLRTSERARNFHTLTEVRDQKSNQMARVNAVKALEQIDDNAQPVGNAGKSAGVTIVIQQIANHATTPIPPKTLELQRSVSGQSLDDD